MFTVVPQVQYYHAQGGCYLCRQSGPLVDTSVQIEGEGVLALCFSCIKTMFDCAGLDATADDEIETLTRRYTEVAEKLQAEEKFSRKLRSEIRALKRPAESHDQAKDAALGKLIESQNQAGPGPVPVNT